MSERYWLQPRRWQSVLPVMESAASVVRDRWSLVLTLAGIVVMSWTSSNPEARWRFSKQEEPRTAATRKDLCARHLEIAEVIVQRFGIGDSQAAMAAKRLMAIASSPVVPRANRGACRARVARLSKKLAHEYLAHGEKTQSADALANAERLYERYIATFPEADDIVAMRYFHVEALWWLAERETDDLAQAGRWERVTQAYEDLKRAGYREPPGCVLHWTQPVGVNRRP
jgi:hypothetical protein